MGTHYDRALLLYQQSRYQLAEQELHQELADEPDNPFAHALLALSLCDRKDHSAAIREAEEAIHLGPDISFTHYALAYVLYQRDHLQQAEAAIEQALALDPEDADYYSLLASIRFEQRNWSAALQAAEEGLAQDAEHGGCTNLRAMSLVKLGRRAEAGAALGDALSRDPEDALTHANQGWTLLEQRQPDKALEHFREALRLEPNLEWAREGIVEALKARHWLYRQILRYFLWMARLSPRARWGVVLGLLIAQRVLPGLAASVLPSLGGILLFCLLVFVFLTWTADPLFNLLLRLNPLGRLALSREQIWASNCVGICLGLAVCSLLAAVLFSGRFVVAAAVFGFLVVPVAGAFQCPAGWKRSVMAGYTVVLVLLGIGGATLFLATPLFSPAVQLRVMPLSVLLFGLAFLGTVASTWLFTLLHFMRLKR